MKMKRSFSPDDRLNSVRYAIDGIKILLGTQHNARIQFFLGIAALLLSWWLDIGKLKFVIILLTVGMVWIAEAFNTVFEIMITILSPQYSAKAKRAKDVAASAVLMASLISATIGFIIFLPPLLIRLEPYLDSLF
jgi:diacylglycerol kinase (ATP)